MATATDGNGNNKSTSSPVIHPSPPTERPFAGRRGESHEYFLAASQEELHASGATSPSYHPTPCSSNHRLIPDENDPYAQYPPLSSHPSSSRAKLLDDTSMGEKDEIHPPPPREEAPTEDEKPKPSVHYQENIKPFQLSKMRMDSSGDYMSSRASSFTEPEDDLEEYDWSGEEDLVDEEAKFEKQMGVRSKPQGWGIRR